MAASNKKSPPIGIDGKYRWLYELTLLNNPKRLFLFWRIGALLVLLLAVSLGMNRGPVDDGFILVSLRALGIGLVIMTAVITIACLVLKKLDIGRSLKLYQMDDESLHIMTLQKNVSKYDIQKALAIMTGQMKGDPRAPNDTLLTNVRGTEKIAYHSVSSVSYHKLWRQIRVKSGLRVYDVFARKSQAEFVLNMIFTKSAKARMAKKG